MKTTILTEEEKMILAGLKQKRTYHELADWLNMPVSFLHTALKVICMKLSVKSTREAIRFAPGT